MRTVWQRVARLVLIAAVCGAANSCSGAGLFRRDGPAISVELSGMAEVYAPMTVVWRISWWDGAAVQTTVLAPRRAVDSVVVRLPLTPHGAEVVVVQATAHPLCGGSLSPLGAWTAPPQTRLNPEPDFGRTAEAVLRVARRGLDPALINLERVHRTVDDECQARPEDLDQERLVAALGRGEMNRYAIRRRPRPGCEVSVVAPENDVWISHDLTEKTIEGVWAEDRCYWVIPVAEGEVRHLWQWFRSTRTAERRDSESHGPAGATPSDSAGALSELSVRVLTVGRDRRGHAFWFISPLR